MFNFSRLYAYINGFFSVSSKQSFLLSLIGKTIYIKSFPFLLDSDFREGEPGEYTVYGVIFYHDGGVNISLAPVGSDETASNYYDFHDLEIVF